MGGGEAGRLMPYLRRRSFSLAGHRTSVALEPAFWAALEAMAAREAVRLVGLVARIDAERDPGRPLASCLRVAALENSSRR